MKESNSAHLTGISAKISRARKCLQSLEADMGAFCEYERRRLAFEIEQGWPRIVSENIPEAPIDYSVRVGEIAYHLRSALDHLVWWLIEDGGETPDFFNAFPIVFGEDGYRKWEAIKKNSDRKLEGLNEGQIDVIELFQPFRDNIAVGPHLRMLNIICNIDKHRHLNGVNLYLREDIHLKEGSDPNLTYPITGGMGLWRELKGTEHEDKVNIEVIADICFTDEYKEENKDENLKDASPGYGSAIEGKGVEMPPVGPALRGCLTAVQFVVDRCSSLFMTWKQDKTEAKAEQGFGTKEGLGP